MKNTFKVPVYLATFRSQKFSLAIVVLCVLSFVYSQFTDYAHVGYMFFETPSTIVEMYRLLSPIFIHGGWFHIVFNMMAFYFFARMIESLHGWKTLMVVGVIIAVISNIAQAAVSDVPFGGISGVVFGVFGYCWAYNMRTKYWHFHVEQSLITQMILWLGIGYIINAVAMYFIDRPFIANTTHLAGLLTGFLLGLLAARIIPLHQPEGIPT